jgi:uncharacterized protein (DUF1501 family)
MLLLGRLRSRICQGLTRRAVLQIGASSVFGLSLADLLRFRAEAGEHAVGTAKSVLLLWMWGGPSHLDTWDPKPNASLDYRGPFGSIATKTTGVRIGELFPKIAKLSDRFAILRSLHTGSSDHGVAGTIGLTGSAAGGVGLDGKPLPNAVRPTTGSVVARVRGGDAKLPPFIVVGGRLHQGKKAIVGEGGGPLGGMYDPFRLEYDPVHGTRIPALQLPDDLTPERLDDRQRLLEAFDQLARQTDAARRSQAIDDYRAQAFAMLTSPDARKMYDLTQEKPALLDRYGRTRVGQSLVLARRLIEHNVPFVQVNWSDHVEAEEDSGDGGWDHHYRNFQIMQDRHGPWMDQAFSALLEDLSDRGLLETTLVVAMGEFGRSPKVNDKAGRDHWEHCYSALFAGGGVRGGRVVGASDGCGERPIDRPATPADVAATIHRAVGMTSEQTQPLGVAVDGKPIEELF